MKDEGLPVTHVSMTDASSFLHEDVTVTSAVDTGGLGKRAVLPRPLSTVHVDGQVTLGGVAVEQKSAATVVLHCLAILACRKIRSSPA